MVLFWVKGLVPVLLKVKILQKSSQRQMYKMKKKNLKKKEKPHIQLTRTYDL